MPGGATAFGHRFALKMCRYHGGAHGTSEWRVDQRVSRSIICPQLLRGLRNVAKLYAHDRSPDPLHGYQYLVQELVPDSLLITDWVKRESPCCGSWSAPSWSWPSCAASWRARASDLLAMPRTEGP